MKHIFAAICLAALTILFSANRLSAHEGHDAVPTVGASIAARGESASDTFEIVAVAEGTVLAVYLERFATNEPIDDAAIEVETPDGPVTANGHTGDAYRIPAPWLAKPGRYDLIFTVTVGSNTEVLPATLGPTLPSLFGPRP